MRGEERKAEAGAVPQTDGNGSRSLDPLALLVLQFVLLGYLLLFLNKRREFDAFFVFRGEADAFLIAVSLCVCRDVEPVAALEPLQRHLRRWSPGALQRVPHLLAGEPRLCWTSERNLLLLPGGLSGCVALLSPALSWLGVWERSQDQGNRI